MRFDPPAVMDAAWELGLAEALRVPSALPGRTNEMGSEKYFYVESKLHIDATLHSRGVQVFHRYFLCGFGRQIASET